MSKPKAAAKARRAVRARTPKPPLSRAPARPGSGAVGARPSAPAWAWALGTWFGSGFSPLIPGTAGTLATLPLCWALGFFLPTFSGWSPWCLAVSILLFFPAVRASTRLEAALGRHDPGTVVVDETLGTLLTMAFLPASAFHHWPAYAAAFFLFRALDVWKPGFVGRSQVLPTGLGIVADDVLAGLLGGIPLGLLWWLCWR